MENANKVSSLLAHQGCGKGLSPKFFLPPVHPFSELGRCGGQQPPAPPLLERGHRRIRSFPGANNWMVLYVVLSLRAVAPFPAKGNWTVLDLEDGGIGGL